MKTDRNTSTTGSLAVQNPAGLSVGVSDTVYTVLKVDTNFVTALENQRQDRDFTIRTRRGNTFDPAFYADASTKRVGIFTETPSVEFDVLGSGNFSGSLTVGGNLTVTGDTTFLDVATIKVEDKNIELAATSTGSLLDNSGVDGAGVIVKSSDNDKTLTWENESGCWTSSEDFDLVSGKSYKINGINKLSVNRLDDSVIYAEGLISVGTLIDLQVDQININDSTITSSNPLNINSNGIITINSQRITGVDDPTVALDVANKRYVDGQIDSEPVVLTLDVTGFSNPSPIFSDNIGPHADIKGILDYLYPATQKANGAEARIYAISYITATVSGIDVNGALNVSRVSVFVDPDDSSTPQLESVVQDINFDPVSGVANLAPARAKIDFIVNAGVWQWVRTTPV